jgi:hypothetical protein
MGESIWADEERAGGDGSIRHLAQVDDGTSSPLVVTPGWVALQEAQHERRGNVSVWSCGQTDMYLLS